MHNFLVAAQAVFPLLVMMMIGYFIRATNVVTEAGLKETNRLIFQIFMPILMFINIITIDFDANFDLSLIIWTPILIIGVFLLLFLVIPRLETENFRRGVLIQGIFRSNFMVFGLSIVAAVYGESQLGAITLLSAITIPLMNALSVVALEFFRGNRPNVKNILLGVVKHPLIIAAGLALLLMAFNLVPPKLVLSPFESLAKVTTPLSLLVIGASFQFKQIKGFKKQLLLGMVGRLIVIPAICLPLCVALGFRNAALLGLLTIFGGPCATSSFAMAQQMGGDGELAGSLVVFTSAFSVLTLFLWILLLNSAVLI